MPNNGSIPMTPQLMRQLRTGSVIVCSIGPCMDEVVELVIEDAGERLPDDQTTECTCRDYYHTGENSGCCFAFDPRGCKVHHHMHMMQGLTTPTNPICFESGGEMEWIRLVKL